MPRVRAWEGGGVKPASTHRQALMSLFFWGTLALHMKCLQFLHTFSSSIPNAPLEIYSKEKNHECDESWLPGRGLFKRSLVDS